MAWKTLRYWSRRGAVLLKALLCKPTCGIPARMQKLELRALPEKCEHVQEEAGAKASKFFLLQTLCPSPDSNEEQLVLQSCRYFHVQGRNLAPTSVAACDEKLTLSSGVWGREEKWLAQQ